MTCVRAPFLPPLFLSLTPYRLRLGMGLSAALPFLLACLPALLSHSHRNLSPPLLVDVCFRAPLFPFPPLFWVRPVSKPRLSLHTFSNALEQDSFCIVVTRVGLCQFGLPRCLAPPSSQPG